MSLGLLDQDSEFDSRPIPRPLVPVDSPPESFPLKLPASSLARTFSGPTSPSPARYSTAAGDRPPLYSGGTSCLPALASWALGAADGRGQSANQSRGSAFGFHGSLIEFGLMYLGAVVPIPDLYKCTAFLLCCSV